jgi:histone H3/H4
MADILVVASKVKKYVRDKSGMNTSAEILDELSRQVERLCDQAIERAKLDGRKTVKGRDLNPAASA